MTYTFLFYKHIIFRHSCRNCHYCNTCRPSDITISDFWGHEKTAPHIADDKGLSLILVNTEKGKRLFEMIQKDLDIIPAKLEDCMQPNLKHPSAMHKDRNAFERYYVKYGLEAAMRRFGDIGWRYYMNIAYKFIRTLGGNILRTLKLR